MFAHHLTGALVGASLLASLAACDHGHEHGPEGHDHPHPGAEANEPIVESHTVYTPRVEHFDEHPRLVAGKPAKFAAHATDIRGETFKAVREGTLVAIALREGKVVAESPA